MKETEEKEIAKQSRSSFYYAFSLLPHEKREAMNTVYAFCRKTDDIVDEGDDSLDIKYAKLHKWRVELEKALYGASEYSLFNKDSPDKLSFNVLTIGCFEIYFI